MAYHGVHDAVEAIELRLPAKATPVHIWCHQRSAYIGLVHPNHHQLLLVDVPYTPSLETWGGKGGKEGGYCQIRFQIQPARRPVYPALQMSRHQCLDLFHVCFFCVSSNRAVRGQPKQRAGLTDMSDGSRPGLCRPAWLDAAARNAGVFPLLLLVPVRSCIN